MLIFVVFPSVAAAAPARSSPIVDPFQNVDPFAFPTDLASPSSISAPNTISSIIQGDPFASSSPALKKREAPKVTPISNGKTSFVRYRALYDYTPTRPDELPVTTGDVILVNPAAQQSADWLEGQLENGKRGYFPANYAEPISRTETTTPASPNNNSNNRNQFESASTLTVSDETPQNDRVRSSPFQPGSWVIAVADCQGKTPDKHLTFQRGDPILVQTQRDNTWYSGQLHGKVHLPPDCRTFVRRLSCGCRSVGSHGITSVRPLSKRFLPVPLPLRLRRSNRPVPTTETPTVVSVMTLSTFSVFSPRLIDRAKSERNESNRSLVWRQPPTIPASRKSCRG